ncbi:FCD domain-containing protein [Streptomyces sp. NPDC002952]|uniref:FCD domain-containing protein n=1 Tax=Streptomyces sp. NPDC002952 TaxID=3364673 RepID=UPI003691D1BE
MHRHTDAGVARPSGVIGMTPRPALPDTANIATWQLMALRRALGTLVAVGAAASAEADHKREMHRRLDTLGRARGDEAVQWATLRVLLLLARVTRIDGLLSLTLNVDEACTPLYHATSAFFRNGTVARDRLKPLADAVRANDPGAARRAADDYFSATEALMLAGLA